MARYMCDIYEPTRRMNYSWRILAMGQSISNEIFDEEALAVRMM
jgi:hypothetical protein